MEISSSVLVLLVVLLIFVFSDQIFAIIDNIKVAVVGDGAEHLEPHLFKHDPMQGHREHMQSGTDDLGLATEKTSEVLTVLGYTGQQPWGEVIKASELDPSTFVNHNEFVKDVRRFSSGANFTSVTDDNTNSDFVNFVGLRRPTHVPIGDTARQQPDVDQSVLQRNKRFSWTDGPNFSTASDDSF